MMEFSHVSVLLDECIEGLAIDPDGIYADLTAGGGGHSLEIVRRLKGGRLIAIDRDDDALRAAGERLRDYKDKVTFVKSNFSEIKDVLDSLGIEKIDGALIDLGVSSFQLDEAGRGFSYMKDAPLDMRMDRSEGKTAFDVVNGYSESELKRVIFVYGEEKFAPRIARNICERRAEKKIETTFELNEVIDLSIPKKGRPDGHPSKRTFQAIRIEVNGELDAIRPALEGAVEKLAVGGRLAVISFHSLEDRIVKQTFASLAKGCTCPPSFPVCVCGKKPKITLVNRKPILPSEEECERNPRSKSAKLRIAERI